MRISRFSILTPVVPSLEEPRAVAVLDDGKILVAGRNTAIDVSGSSTSRPAVVQFNADGSLDTSFGNQGKAVADLGDGGAESLVVGQDGAITIASEVLVPRPDPNDCCSRIGLGLARFQSNGSPDTNFNRTGAASIEFADSPDGWKSLAIQPDGKLLLAGRSGSSADSWGYLIRHVP